MFRRRIQKRRRSRNGGSRGRRIRYRKFAKRVYKAVLSRAEKKVQYVSIYATTGFSIQAGLDALLWPLIAVPGGTGEGERIGNKIRVRYICINGLINANGITDLQIRVSIVRGRTLGLGLTDTPVLTLQEFWDKDRWDVIMDRTYHPGSLSENGASIRNVKYRIKVFKDIIFNNSNADSIVTNPYYLYITSNDAVLPSPIWYGNLMLTYSDI